MSNKGFTYTLKLDAEISDLTAKTAQVKKSMQSIMDAGKAPGAEKIFTSIEKALDKMREKASQPITSIAAFESLQKDANAAGTALNKLGSIVDDLGKMSAAEKMELLPPDLKQKIADANTALGTFAKAQAQAAEKSQDLVDAEKQLATAQKELSKAEGKVSDKKALINAQQQMVDKTRAEADAIKAKLDALKKYQSTSAAYDAAGGNKSAKGSSKANAGKGLDGLNLPADRAAAQAAVPGLDLKNAQAMEAELARLNDQYREASKAVTDAEATQRRYGQSLATAQNAATLASSKITTLSGTVNKLNNEFEKNKAQDTQAAYAQLRAEAGKLGVDLSNIPVDYTEQNFNELNAAMNQLAVNGISQVDIGLNSVQTEMGETSTAAQNLANGMDVAKESVTQLDAKVADARAFTSRIQQFVGLQGAIQVARRAMRNAFTTIKELDQAMTEMAVVTDLEVGDYWNQMPQHTKSANELGVAIKDVYQAETLYYQQGLKTNEVMAMSTETLKMARIAGLSAEDATNKMTAALRGFNMELNETSAQRVADVYSQLAAITASDVDEISSAMTKTASIAASAGMEFETTAAFLSQIIETTRESAETAGTALKTVIARFQELKKDPSEIGEVDGEIVDANKIETALRSVGVSLRDAQGQFRELDDVFLELSGKWDSLDTNTQRYIATIAAGSRQQSRFIAMMSDYSRTTELVSAANNSAGASQKQFEKTMDSLEAKLNELKNAWDSFTLGIMNSDVLKAGIDILTAILTAINNITDAFGQFSGAAKIAALVAALYLGDRALKVFTASLAKSGSVFSAFGAVGSSAIHKIKAGFQGLRQSLTKLTKTKVAINLNPAEKAMKNYTKAVNNQVAAQKLRTSVENNASLTAEARATRMATLSNIEIANEQRKTAAVGEYAAAMGLSAAQTAVYNGLVAAGVAPELAATAAMGGLTAAKMADYQASMIAQGLAPAEIATRMTQIASLYAEAGAEGANTAAKTTGIAAIWGKITALATQIATTIMTTLATWGLVAAETAAAPPILVLVVAVGILVIGLLALVGVIMLIVAAYNKWKNSQPDAQLAALEEKAEQSRKVAEETKKAYDELLSAKDEYDGMTNQVESLTEGTTAWKEAVAELNNKIMELITLYPQLAQFVEIAENGQMSISDKGWEQIIEDQQKKVQISQAKAGEDQIEYLKKQKELSGHKTKKISETYYIKNSTGKKVNKSTATKGQKGSTAADGYTRKTRSINVVDYDVGADNEEALQKLSKLKYGTQEYNKAMAELRKSIGDTNTEQLAALNSFDETAKSLAALDKQIDTHKTNALRSLGSATAQIDADYGRMIDSLDDYYDEIDKATDKASAEKWKNKGGMWTNGNNGTNDALKKELLEYNLSSSENEVKDMAALLAAKGGKQYTEEELEELGKGADNQLAKDLEAIDSTVAKADYVNALYELQETNEQIGDLYSGSLDVSLDGIDAQIEAIENVDANVTSVLKKAVQNRKKTIEDERKNIELELESIYGEPINVQQFAGSYDQAQEFIQTYQTMMSGVGGGLATSFADMFKDMDVDQQQDFFDAYGNVDWSSSIDGAAALKEMLESDSVAMQEFAAKSIFLEQSTYSATAQMNEFYRSLGDDALKELAADGKITATEMLEMAKSNEKLATMMETTGVSAATLANYYELLEEGTISAFEATNNFIEALDKLNAASNAIENSFGFIDTFEPSRSQTEISEYFAGMRESAMELYDMGAYGDQQLKDYIQAFLGEDNWQAIIDKNNGDMKAALDEAMNQINSYGENLYGTWQTLAEQGLQGVTMGEDGSVLFDMTQIGDLDQLKQQITDMGWSEAMADALIADAQTFSADLKDNLDQVGVQAAFESWLSDAFSINGKTVIPKGQVEAMAKELGVTVKQLTEDLEMEGISVGEWVTEDGKVGEDFKELREQMIQDAKDAGKFDLDTNYQMLLELGLEDEEAKTQLNAMANSLEGVPFSLDGQSVVMTNGILYEATEDGVSTGVKVGEIEGVVQGLTDPKTKAAQELSAIEQGEMMAEANATGSIVASTAALKAAAQGVDELINGALDVLNLIPGVNIAKSNLSGKVTDLNNTLINAATTEIYARNTAKKSQLNATLATNSLGKADASAATSKLVDKYTTETKKITSSYTNPNAQKAGQKGGGEDFEAWENAYDEIYNLNQQINVLIREREKLERNYERALKDSSKTAAELAKITGQELEQLQKEAIAQKDIAQWALAKAQGLQAANTQFEGLYSFDETTGQVIVDWEMVGAMGWSSDQGQAFEDFISALEEQGDTYREAQDSLDDIYDSVDEIEQRGRDAASTIYDQVKEGLVKQYEDQLDALETVNESIQEASDALVSKIQEQIDDARQARDNEKTEQAINDKRMRLAYLQRDTSGGNAMEIAALQKEIDEEQESYTGSLIDQAIEKLQDANEKAAEQREQQLEIQRAQLDEYINAGKIWNEVQRLVDDGFMQIANGVPFASTEAGKLAIIAGNTAELNPLEKEDFYNELDRNAKEGAIHQGFVSISGALAGDGQTLLSATNSLKAAIDGYAKATKETPHVIKMTTYTSGGGDGRDGGDRTDNDEVAAAKALLKSEFVDKFGLDAYNEGIHDWWDDYFATPEEHRKVMTRERYDELYAEVGWNGVYGFSYEDYVWFMDFMKSTFKGFNTGGLADFTGPAWLDGTKSKPEIVLNQNDSANFMILRDILADILDGTSDLSQSDTANNKRGDNYYDIEINVDSINDDYDVEQLANKIKSMIYEDSIYRNVNMVSGIR